MFNQNPTILKVAAELSKGPSTAKELSEATGVDLGNVIAILIASKWAYKNGEKWELCR